jgi:hypothetical protein
MRVLFVRFLQFLGLKRLSWVLWLLGFKKNKQGSSTVPVMRFPVHAGKFSQQSYTGLDEKTRLLTDATDEKGFIWVKPNKIDLSRYGFVPLHQR